MTLADDTRAAPTGASNSRASERWVRVTQDGDFMIDATQTFSSWSGTIKGRPKVGAFAERAQRIGMRDIAMFTQTTGDRDPLHYDPELAERTPFRRLIVPGAITSGLLYAIVAEDLPGPGSVFLEVEWRFVKAVGVGEEITGRVEVSMVREDKPICTLRTTVRNAQGEICLTGAAVTYTMPLREEALF